MSEKADPAEKGTIMLKLNDVSTYMTKVGKRTVSRRQQVAGIEWHLHAFPSVEDNVTHLECYLGAADSSTWSAWVDATVLIVKQNGDELGKATSLCKTLMGSEPLTDCWGWNAFITSEELLSAHSGYVLNDSVEIRADFSVTGVCGASFNAFETKGALAADVKLKVGDSLVYGNKGYLSVVSSVFRDMFALVEAAGDKKETEEIELKDLDASEFRDFLGVIYPTRYTITDANVISVFRLADRFDVKHVVADCERHLLSANNVPLFHKLKLATDLDRDDFQYTVISNMTCDDLETIREAEGLDQLGAGALQALFEKHVDIHHS